MKAEIKVTNAARRTGGLPITEYIRFRMISSTFESCQHTRQISLKGGHYGKPVVLNQHICQYIISALQSRQAMPIALVECKLCVMS